MLIVDFLGDLVPNTVVYLQVVRFVIVFMVGLVATRAILMPAIGYLMRRREATKRARHTAVNVGGIIGIFFSFTIALQAGNFGNLVTVIGTVTAALTVAIGFGMRDQVSNLLAGIFLFLDAPFVRGDYIETEDTEGVVQEITLRSTTLRGRASQTVVVPNSQLTMEEVRNYTREVRTKCAIALELRNDRIEEATDRLTAFAVEQDAVLSRPEPTVFYTDEDGRVSVELHYWVREPEDVKPVKSEILSAFNEIAVEEGYFPADGTEDE